MTTNDSSVGCAVCACNSPAGDTPHRHIAEHNNISYTLHRCPSCDLQFWWPLEADPSVYENEGFEAYKDYHSGARPFPRWADALFASLPTSGGRALDVGCGDGAVLNRLASLGFEPYGIDLDEKSIAVARKKYGLAHVKSATLHDYAASCIAQQIRFDLITFFEVLEHQDNPRAFMTQVATIARPGAWIAGSVPNRKRFLAGLDRKLSTGDLPPHHFLWFSDTALRQLLERSNFSSITIDRVGALSYAQLTIKLRAAVDRMTSSWPRLVRVAAKPLFVLFSWAGALVPWIGRRFAPSHLFFKCRAPETQFDAHHAAGAA